MRHKLRAAMHAHEPRTLIWRTGGAFEDWPAHVASIAGLGIERLR
jgi:hypothetical protein